MLCYERHLIGQEINGVCTASYTDLTNQCFRWLFDRVVESPHRTSFYARNTVDIHDEEVQEAARYWFVITFPHWQVYLIKH
jgi:hypothetical protein